MLWFFKHTYLHVLIVICRICVSYFAASLTLLHTIGRHDMWWCESMKKVNSTPISTSTELIMNFGIISGIWDLKIGEASVFLWSHTNRWYGALLYTKISDWLRNMVIEFPLFHILHAKPCLHRMYPKIECVLRQHGFGWQTWNTGSSAPMLIW